MKVDSYVIAKIVGVSQATVSRAFSKPEKVSPETRKRIMEVAESLDYKLDKNARALRRKGTNTILLLYVKRQDGHYWTNVKRNFWIFSEAVLTLTQFFESQPYFFEVKQVSSIYTISAKEIQSHCDGVIVFDFVTDEEASYISEWKIPYVICHRAIHLTRGNISATDNYRGGSLQAEFLQEQNCINPVYILDKEDPFSHNLRLEGFVSIFPQAKILYREIHSHWLDTLEELVTSNTVDGIAFVNDMLLVQTVTALYKRNLYIQNSFTLIGYDNSTELLVLEKKPATIDIGISKIYEDAADSLLKLIDGDIQEIHLIHSPELKKEE